MSLPFRAPLAEYQRQAEKLLVALQSGDEAARGRIKWEHPRFRDKSFADVTTATLDLADAQLVVARENASATWADLSTFTDAVANDGPVVECETGPATS